MLIHKILVTVKNLYRQKYMQKQIRDLKFFFPTHMKILDILIQILKIRKTFLPPA